MRPSRGLIGRSARPIARLEAAGPCSRGAPQQPTGCCHAGTASLGTPKRRYLQPADPPSSALSWTGRKTLRFACFLAGRCWCATLLAACAADRDSRPVALNSRRFRAAPTARQVAAAQGRAACLPTLAHARVGLHGSSVRMPTIATYCIYSTKRTYHPASAGGRHSTGSRRREYFSGVILFCAPRRTKTPLRSARADAFPARCGSWQVHSISPPARRCPMRRSIRREPQHVRIASTRALPLSGFVLSVTENKIAP